MIFDLLYEASFPLEKCVHSSFFLNVWNFTGVCLGLGLFWSILLSGDFRVWRLITFSSGKFSWIIYLVIFLPLFLLFSIFASLITVNLDFPDWCSSFLIFFLWFSTFCLVPYLLANFILIIKMSIAVFHFYHCFKFQNPFCFLFLKIMLFFMDEISFFLWTLSVFFWFCFYIFLFLCGSFQVSSRSISLGFSHVWAFPHTLDVLWLSSGKYYDHSQNNSVFTPC